MSIKHEMHKGRPSWVVNGVVRTYDEAEALRLDSADETTPIDMLATDKFIVSFDGCKCVLTKVERRAVDSPLRALPTPYLTDGGEEDFRDRLRTAELNK